MFNQFKFHGTNYSTYLKMSCNFCIYDFVYGITWKEKRENNGKEYPIILFMQLLCHVLDWQFYTIVFYIMVNLDSSKTFTKKKTTAYFIKRQKKYNNIMHKVLKLTIRIIWIMFSNLKYFTESKPS